MDESSHWQVAALFDELIDLSPAERHDRLTQLTALDSHVAAQLRKLVGATESVGDFLGALPAESDRRNGAPESDAPNALIAGRYRLIRRLSEGGTGDVWLARDSGLERPIALKLFRGRDAETADRMRDEARLAARLDHPHIAIVHEIGVTTDGVPFIAMAWSTAGSLADRIAKGPVSVLLALDIGIQAAHALGAAHSAGIVHGDVKPGNLLLSEEGLVRLADFGAAHRTGTNDAPPAVGTLRFMSPERLRGTGFDHRADLWALGVTLFQSLTGRLPFQGGSAGAVMYNVVMDNPSSPGQLVDLPRALDALIVELLAKDPADRPATANQVAARLEEIRVGVLARQRTTSAPVSATPLIGRDTELRQALALLDERRLVTLTGPGGTGKTRLALEIAAHAESRYTAGSCFVELAALRNTTQVPNLIAQTMGVVEGGATAVTEQLIRACRGVDRLLVLDNCEHLESVGQLVSTLLAAAPELRIVATSRSPLAIVGEQEFALLPLALPSLGNDRPEEVERAPAVALLLARIRDRDPAFAVSRDNVEFLTEICRRLDGLPLAIELAAARVRTLGCAAVASRLSDSTTWLRAMDMHRPTRHQTLDAAIEWSYDLLNEDEQRMFRHLAPFVGGFDLDAVNAIAAAIGLRQSPEDLLESLIDKSLAIPARIDQNINHFVQLVTIREYAAARLHESGEETIARTNHAEHFFARARMVAKEMYGPHEAEAHAQLRADQANLHDTLDWFTKTGKLADAARLAVLLHRHWLLSGRFVRQIVAKLKRVDQGLMEETPRIPASLHADLLKVLGSLSGVAGAHQQVPWSYFERAQAMYRAAGDRHGEALALNHLGWSSLLLGRYDDVERYSSAAQALHEDDSNTSGVGVSHINLGWAALMRADLALAEQHFATALKIQESLGDQRATAYANGHLATVALRRGDPDGALRYLSNERMTAFDRFGDRVAGPTFELRRMVALHEMRYGEPTLERIRDTILPQLRESNHGWSLSFALAMMGRLLIDNQDPVAACAALEEAQRVAETAGLVSLTADCQALRAEALLRASQLDAAGKYLKASVAVRQRIGEPLGVVEDAEVAAEWLAMRHRSRVAMSMLTGTAAVRRALRTAPLPRLDDRLANLKARLLSEMPADTAAAAQRVGEALTWHDLGDAVIRELAR